MNNEESILFEVKDGVATLLLNRPKSLNALDETLARRLCELLAKAEEDPNIRVVLIKGSRGNFMAGGDIRLFASILEKTSQERQEILRAMFGHVHQAIEHIHRIPKPVVACLDGAVAGFGVSLMAACDLAIATDHTYFNLAYCHLGVSVDGGASFLLPRLIGMRRALELSLLGDRLEIQSAYEMGLVNWVVSGDELEETTQKLVYKLAKGPALAHRHIKSLMRNSFTNSLSQQLKLEEEGFSATASSADFAEGVTAFLEKRRPVFQGH